VSEWVVLLHVARAFWFVAGMLGRNVTMAKARPATDTRRAAIRAGRSVDEVKDETKARCATWAPGVSL
jgi:hypothetical protein